MPRQLDPNRTAGVSGFKLDEEDRAFLLDLMRRYKLGSLSAAGRFAISRFREVEREDVSRGGGAPPKVAA